MGLFDFIKLGDDGEISEDCFELRDYYGDMYSRVGEKCGWGEDLDKLDEHERVYFVAQELEGEVNNGGFAQYFYNGSGDHANEIVEAFTKIGALKTAEICKKALSVFGGEVPTDRDMREELLDSMDCDELLEECDNAFYLYEDNLQALNEAYVEKYLEN